MPTTRGMPDAWRSWATLPPGEVTDPCAALSHDASVTTLGRRRRSPIDDAEREGEIRPRHDAVTECEAVAGRSPVLDLGAVGEDVHVGEPR